MGQKPLPALDPSRYSAFFAYRGGRLYAEQVPVEAVAARVGTPVYVYSRAGVETAWRKFDRACSRAAHTVCYSVKANSNLAILAALARLGSGFDIVSGGELERLRRIGVRGNRIVFSGVGKTREEIREALRAGILLFNVESEAELEALAEEASRKGIAAPAALRVNPDVGAGAHPHISTGRRVHKFGIDWQRAMEVYRVGARNPAIRWRGLTAHIGSQVLALDPFRRALDRLAILVDRLRREGVSIDFLDIGGGLGVRYAHERPPSLGAYGSLVAGAARRIKCHLLLEPGRALVASAGILLASVLYEKSNGGKSFLVVDAGMNDLMRPALYGAVHPATGVRPISARAKLRRVDIVGPVCETGDSFLSGWPMPEMSPGDLVAIWGAGAYGFALSSNYNSRRRAAEVLVEGRRFRVVRRRETYADLVRAERR